MGAAKWEAGDDGYRVGEGERLGHDLGDGVGALGKGRVGGWDWRRLGKGDGRQRWDWSSEAAMVVKFGGGDGVGAIAHNRANPEFFSYFCSSPIFRTDGVGTREGYVPTKNFHFGGQQQRDDDEFLGVGNHRVSVPIEDLLESHVSSKFLSESEAPVGDDGEISINPLTLSQDLAWKLEEEIELLDYTVENIKNLLRLEEDESTKLKDWLTGESRKLEIVSILGPAGVGKSTLAKQVYEDPAIVSHFDHRAFVSIGLKGVRRQILLGILAQLKPWEVDESHAEIDETSAQLRVYRELRRGRYLIMLDDVWTRRVWDDLRRFFPDNVIGSRIVVTTRLQKVADYISPDAGKFLHKKRRLNEADSWKLLREMVFGWGGTCPPSSWNLERR
ncbi:UNVERIFIED_CONTAM: putative disease resistance protein [Sesamum latifolium]|uniref:Disease resistance protein n=1 Tax=Sesamum latifolium TaxID=2727402 RepID=A0AAW2XRI0_9LAMI